MSDQFNDDDDLQDPYERSSGGGGAPVVSWKYVKPTPAGGEQFVGVVLPPVPAGPKAAPGMGYQMKRDWQNGSDQDPDDKGFLVWPPRNNPEKIKRPVTERRHQELWPDVDINERDGQGRRLVRPVSRVNVTFHTGYAAGEFISESTAGRMVEQEMDPNAETQRRMILNSKDLEDKLLAAYKAIGTDRPQPGQKWTIGVDARQPNQGRQGSTTIYNVKVEAPTDETRKIVSAYVEAKQTEAAQAEAANDGDPYAAGPAKTTQTENPPF